MSPFGYQGCFWRQLGRPSCWACSRFWWRLAGLVAPLVLGRSCTRRTATSSSGRDGIAVRVAGSAAVRGAPRPRRRALALPARAAPAVGRGACAADRDDRSHAPPDVICGDRGASPVSVTRLPRLRLTNDRSAFPFAMVALVLALAWLVTVASVTVGYLSPVISQAIRSVYETLSREAARALCSAGSATRQHRLTRSMNRRSADSACCFPCLRCASR